MTIVVIAINLVRGTPKVESVFGIDECGALSWSLLGCFTILCLVIVYYNTQQVYDEQQLKLKYNVGLCKSDLVMDKKNITTTLTVGFMCSFVGQIFGFGGAIFFNPVQVFLGINPLVAATTSQYI